MKRLTVGPATLAQYRSVWDFPGGTILLIPLRWGAGPHAPYRRFVKDWGVPRDLQACMLGA